MNPNLVYEGGIYSQKRDHLPESRIDIRPWKTKHFFSGFNVTNCPSFKGVRHIISNFVKTNWG